MKINYSSLGTFAPVLASTEAQALRRICMFITERMGMTKAVRGACEWLGKLIYSVSTREVYETNIQTNTLPGSSGEGRNKDTYVHFKVI